MKFVPPMVTVREEEREGVVPRAQLQCRRNRGSFSDAPLCLRGVRFFFVRRRRIAKERWRERRGLRNHYQRQWDTKIFSSRRSRSFEIGFSRGRDGRVERLDHASRSSAVSECTLFRLAPSGMIAHIEFRIVRARGCWIRECWIEFEAAKRGGQSQNRGGKRIEYPFSITIYRVKVALTHYHIESASLWFQGQIIDMELQIFDSQNSK